jgi:hypothetical protein
MGNYSDLYDDLNQPGRGNYGQGGRMLGNSTDQNLFGDSPGKQQDLRKNTANSNANATDSGQQKKSKAAELAEIRLQEGLLWSKLDQNESKLKKEMTIGDIQRILVNVANMKILHNGWEEKLRGQRLILETQLPTTHGETGSDTTHLEEVGGRGLYNVSWESCNNLTLNKENLKRFTNSKIVFKIKMESGGAGETPKNPKRSPSPNARNVPKGKKPPAGEKKSENQKIWLEICSASLDMNNVLLADAFDLKCELEMTTTIPLFDTKGQNAMVKKRKADLVRKTEKVES